MNIRKLLEQNRLLESEIDEESFGSPPIDNINSAYSLMRANMERADRQLRAARKMREDRAFFEGHVSSTQLQMQETNSLLEANMEITASSLKVMQSLAEMTKSGAEDARKWNQKTQKWVLVSVAVGIFSLVVGLGGLWIGYISGKEASEQMAKSNLIAIDGQDAANRNTQLLIQAIEKQAAPDRAWGDLLRLAPNSVVITKP